MHECDSDIGYEAHIPDSVYADHMAAGTIPDPIYRKNEFAFFQLMKKDWEHVCLFRLAEEILTPAHVKLVCEDPEPLADVSLNSTPIGHADNMHITWEWDLKPILRGRRPTYLRCWDEARAESVLITQKQKEKRVTLSLSSTMEGSAASACAPSPSAGRRISGAKCSVTS